MVPAGELAAMPTNLGRFPPQALKAELAGVLPVNSGGVWGMDASVFFSNLILDKTVTVQVYTDICINRGKKSCTFYARHSPYQRAARGTRVKQSAQTQV